MSAYISPLNRYIWFFRHCLFYALIIPATVFFAVGGTFICLLGPRPGYKFVTRWSWLYINWAKICFNLDFEVSGKENLPQKPCVVVANHQSIWETLFMQVLLPQQSWVLKRELLWIPFFGWGLALLQPISIRRKERSSIKHLLKEGTKRLRSNRWVVIYPEGTRVKITTFKNYSRSAAALALHANVPIIPIAHNAGFFWPKGLWVKQSGTIQVKIGPPLSSKKQSNPSEITENLRQWINAERKKMPPFTKPQ